MIKLISTTGNGKFYVRDGGLGWRALEALELHHQPAKCLNIGLCTQLADVALLDGPRVVSALKGAEVHTGWKGNQGLFSDQW